jgi:hypothetical protein
MTGAFRRTSSQQGSMVKFGGVRGPTTASFHSVASVLVKTEGAMTGFFGESVTDAGEPMLSRKRKREP